MKKYLLLLSCALGMKATCKAHRFALMPGHVYGVLGGGISTAAAALVEKTGVKPIFLSHITTNNQAGDYQKPYLLEGRLSIGYSPLVYRWNQDISVVLGLEASAYKKYIGKATLTDPTVNGIIDHYDLVGGFIINLFYKYYRGGLSVDLLQYRSLDWRVGNTITEKDKMSKAFAPGLTLSFGYEFMKRMELMVYIRTSYYSDFGQNDVSKYKSDTSLGYSGGVALKIHG